MGTKQKSLKLNIVMNGILTMSSVVFPLITYPYVARILTPVGMGKISFAASLVSYFSMFAQLGIPAYGIRACAKVRDNREELTRTVQEIFLINFAMCLLSYTLLLFSLAFVPRLQDERMLYLVISGTILFNAIGMEWLYKGLEQYAYITIRSILFKIIAIVGMFLLVHQREDYVIYGGVTIFAASASNILNFVNARRYIEIKPVGGYRFRRHFKAIGVFFAMSCATTVYTNLDTVMLGFMKTDTDVGYYNAAVRIKIISVDLVTSLGAALLPRASYYIEHGMKDDFKRISRKALNFVFLAAPPMLLYFILFAKQGIYFLSGPSYTDAILPMRIIMPTLLLIGISYQLGIQILVPLGREKIVLYSEIAGAATDLIANALLIPRFSAAGAAMGTLIAEAVVLIFQCVALKKELIDLFREVHYIRILGALVLAAAASIWTPALGFGNFLTLAVSAILFFSVYGGFLILLREPLIIEIVLNVGKKFVYNWK